MKRSDLSPVAGVKDRTDRFRNGPRFHLPSSARARVRQKQVAAIFPLTPPASVRLVAARHDGNTLTPTRSATPYSVAAGERVHQRDRGGAAGLDHLPHHPVAAKRSDLHLERVASHSAGAALSPAPARFLSRR